MYLYTLSAHIACPPNTMCDVTEKVATQLFLKMTCAGMKEEVLYYFRLFIETDLHACMCGPYYNTRVP